MQQEEIYPILGKYLAQEATQDEVKQVKAWIAASPENESAFIQLKKFWEQTQFNYQDAEKEEVFQKISSSIQFPQQATANHPSGRQRSLWKPLSLAAAVVLILISVWWAFQQVPADHAAPKLLSKWEQRENPRGQRSKIFLPDGSIVYLNAESQIRFQRTFDSTIRLVELRGEAFFEVKPNPEKPFVVQSKGVKTVALGTSFNVYSFPDDREVRVSLATGKVKVTQEAEKNQQELSDTATVILLPGEEAAIDEGSHQVKKQSFDPEMALGWKDGVLHLEKAQFKEIISKLERWYNVEFIVKNSSKTSGTFTDRFSNESLEMVMEGLSFSYGFQYKIDNKTVTIY